MQPVSRPGLFKTRCKKRLTIFVNLKNCVYLHTTLESGKAGQQNLDRGFLRQPKTDFWSTKFRSQRMEEYFTLCHVKPPCVVSSWSEIMAKKRNAFDEFLDSVGGNIHRIRMKKGHTLEQLGRSVGLDKSNMHRIEQGKNITLVTLLKISATLDVKPTELLKSDVAVTASDAEAFVKRKKRK